MDFNIGDLVLYQKTINNSSKIFNEIVGIIIDKEWSGYANIKANFSPDKWNVENEFVYSILIKGKIYDNISPRKIRKAK